MEEIREEGEELQSGAVPETPQRRPPEPRVRVVLLAQLGLSLVLTMAGALVFQVIALAFGWDQGLMSGALSADAPPAERWQMRLFLTISHFSTFILAGWLTVRVFYPPAQRSMRYLRCDTWPGASALLLGILGILAATPLVLYSFTINKMLPIPEELRLMEEQTNEAIKGLLQMNSPLELAANLLLIAGLPALGEELVFRGVIQQQLMRRIANPAVAVVVAAFIFSFIHFQFEGFIPRFLLGFLLGWLYWSTQNFWVPVAAHFANNAVQVVGQYLYSRELSTIDLEKDIDVPWYAAVVSLVLVLVIMRRVPERD